MCIFAEVFRLEIASYPSQNTTRKTSYPSQNTHANMCYYHDKNNCFEMAVFVHTEKSFRNLIKSTRNQIVFTMHRLIWNSKRTSVWFQLNRKMVNTIWFRFDLIIFRKNFKISHQRTQFFSFPQWTLSSHHQGAETGSPPEARSEVQDWVPSGRPDCWPSWGPEAPTGWPEADLAGPWQCTGLILFPAHTIPTLVVVRWKHDKNGNEAREETEGKSGRVNRGR